MIFASLTLIFGPPGLAEEVDDFTPHPHQTKDAADIIDIATNSLLDELVNLLNQTPGINCEDPIKYQLALKKLDQNFTAIGNGLRAGPEIATLLSQIKRESTKDNASVNSLQTRLSQIKSTWLAEFTPAQRDRFAQLFSSIDYFGPRENKGSIYEGLDFLTCCTARIHLAGVSVGIDKVDHFFGNGGLLFEQFLNIQPSNMPLDEKLERVMAMNVRQEHSLWGLKGVSPKSYGDLASNWHGVHFYRRLFDLAPTYFLCDNGHFKRQSKVAFHIADYVDESWNESTNCSSFANAKDQTLFQKNLDKANLTCPRDPKICSKLVKKYQDDPLFIKYSLSPLCSRPDLPFTPIEEPAPITWAELSLSLRGFTWPIIKDVLWSKARSLFAYAPEKTFEDINIEEGQSVFSQLRDCRKNPMTTQTECLRRFTEPGLSRGQLGKFSYLLNEGVDFSTLDRCPTQLEQLELRIHPLPLGDLSLCFKTHYRSFETQGRIYFRRHPDGLKVVLLRF